ncbi:MAG: hypothetical protein ACE5H8_11490 [Alphaproteobacteria bacterium]
MNAGAVRPVARALAVGAVLALAGCHVAGHGNTPIATPVAVPAAEPPPVAAPPPPVAAPPAEADNAGPAPLPTVPAAEIARLTPPEAPPTEAPPAVDDDPEQIMGLDHDALEALLGAPGFLRDEAPAQVWQYRGEGCVLDVYLYTDGADAPYRVEYYEIRGDAEPGAEEKRRCFRGLLRDQGEG